MSKIFEDLLQQDGRLVYKTRGSSMKPMLYQNRDLVIIEIPDKILKPYDVAFYKRNEYYILHRVISVDDRYYYIRGDNTYSIEMVPHTAVIGVLTGFIRKGKQYNVTDKRYCLYARFWCAFYPVRKVYRRLRAVAGRIARKMGIR